MCSCSPCITDTTTTLTSKERKKKNPYITQNCACVHTSTAKYRVPSRRSGAHMKTRTISCSHVAFGLLTPASQGHGDFRASRESERRKETITEQTCFILAPKTQSNLCKFFLKTYHIFKKCLQKSYYRQPKAHFLESTCELRPRSKLGPTRL